MTVINSAEFPTVLDYLQSEKLAKRDPFKAVVFTESTDMFSSKSMSGIESTDLFCRNEGITFILANVYGCFGRIVTDFGDQFKVLE